EIARRMGAKVFEHSFTSHSNQWEWALGALPLRGEWVMGLDADQRVTQELIREIESLGGDRFRDVQGVFVKRKQIFRGQWIRHGGYYPKYLLKVFRAAAVRIDRNDLVDHHFHVNGAVVKLDGDLVERNRKEDDIGFWIEKHCRYAKKLAEEE